MFLKHNSGCIQPVFCNFCFFLLVMEQIKKRLLVTGPICFAKSFKETYLYSMAESWRSFWHLKALVSKRNIWLLSFATFSLLVNFKLKVSKYSSPRLSNGLKFNIYCSFTTFSHLWVFFLNCHNNYRTDLTLWAF